MPVPGVWHHARFRLAEDAITMTCDKVIEAVTERSRHDSPQPADAPDSAECAREEQHGITFPEQLFVALAVIQNRVDSIQFGRVDPVTLQNLGGKCALEGRETKEIMTIALYQELDCAVAEPTHSVIKDDCFCAGFSDCLFHAAISSWRNSETNFKVFFRTGRMNGLLASAISLSNSSTV